MANQKDFKRINWDLIRVRSKEIRNGLARLRKYLDSPLPKFMASSERIAASKYEIIFIVEAAVVICNHLAVRFASRVPESYADCFSILKDVQIISEELANRLSKMAQFRNLLVHRYWIVDEERVYTNIKNGLIDLEDYLREIGEFLERKGKENE